MRIRSLVAAALAVLSILGLGAHRPATAIVNGKAAASGQFPFMAALIDKDGYLFCGGSVVANDWILTAAHCVLNDEITKYTVKNPEEVRVVTGRTNLSRSGGQIIAVDEIRVHPRYDGSAHDVAMLHLKTPTTSPTIRLAGGADNDLEADGTPVTVAGWGDTRPTLGAFATNQLRYTELKVVNDTKCGQRNIGFDPATGVCAAELLTDSCNGDSGGPLWGTKAGALVQVGVVSYGLSCGVPDFPGVYSEVNNASINSFINGAVASR